MLSRDDILASTLRTADVEVPEWGGTVRLRSLTAAERLELFALLSSSDAHSTEYIVVHSVVNERGEQLFSDLDYETLAQMDGHAIDTVVRASLKHSLIGDVDPAKN